MIDFDLGEALEIGLGVIIGTIALSLFFAILGMTNQDQLTNVFRETFNGNSNDTFST